MLARLGIFCVATLVWGIAREQGSQLSLLALVASQTALILFLVTSFPLVPSEGQRWLGVMLNEPRLMAKMLMSLNYLFRGGRMPPMMSKADIWPMALFGIGTILTSLALVGFVASAILIYLARTLDGLGVIIFLVGSVACALWLTALVRTQIKKPKQFDKAAFKQIAMASETGKPVKAEGEEEEEMSLGSRAKVFWALVLVALIGVAFLPYDYYAGGQVEILPTARGQAVARTEGELVEILVDEGIEVEAGETVARLSSWDQESEIFVTEERLEGAQASLARLMAGAKQEEIELARTQVESAQSDVEYYEAEAERARKLVLTGTVSSAALERAESDLAKRLANLEVARASLELVESPPTTEEVAVSEAEVARLERELEFAKGELERTHIITPVAGRVVTGNLELKLGRYMRPGDVLMEIEQSSVVQAEISVPESDITLISLGDTVRLRTWGNSRDVILGTVETVAPAAEDEGYGSVVRVGASFPNEGDKLRSGMTGYAKIFGGEMRVWQAYLRSIMRFVQVEVWSWVP